ncbi:MAG: hypothetical protein IJN48_05950 [Clostridia bacterium]|nr:hypothetical protein [Clostridia bacterium]
MTEYILSGISLSLDSTADEAVAAAAKRLRRAGVKAERLSLYRRSIDARDKRDIKLVYAVRFASCGMLKRETEQKLNLQRAASDRLDIAFGSELLGARPVVVGMGPCGLFASLLLAKNGYKPLLIERGGDVSSRVQAVDEFYKNGILDENCNIQFGAGGAGTFSDGKLVTRITDNRCAYVLRELYELGAPKEILTMAKPHIGTDILREVVAGAAKRIVEYGGEIMYNTSLVSIGEKKNGVRTLHTSRGDIVSSATVLAIGHSARDTYEMLLQRGTSIEAKDFSVGFRIEHLKEDIDRALYGDFAGHRALPYGEYNLSYNTKARGVYTFCMCPGGEVVAGASERGGLCVNGMSRYKRDGKNSNSAVCVSVFKSDYGATPRDAIEFQRKLERTAFEAGGGDYAAPVSSVGRFLGGNDVKAIVAPTYMGGKVKEADLDALLPKELTDTLKAGLSDFGKKIKGFDSPHAMLSGVETRTSAPLRILRGDDFTMIGESDIYPGGEGAGYAGGITSAAVDGIKIAEKIISRYKPME